MSALLKYLLLIIITSLSFGQGPSSSEIESDSLITETALKDSSLARAISFKSYKPLSLIKTEKSFKYQLIKLVLISQGRYLNYYLPTEMLFEEIDHFSDRTKKKMLFLALGGGIASQTMTYCRRLLRKKNIDFITPNLRGLHIYSRPLPFKSKAMFRLANYNDMYFVTYIKNGLFTLSQRKTSYYVSRGIYYRLTKSFRLLCSKIEYPHTDYYNLGLSFYSKWLSLYFVFQKNDTNAKWNRAYIDWQLRF
jgi:hypothetical protein